MIAYLSAHSIRLVHVVVSVWLCLFASALVEALSYSCFVMAMLALPHVLFLVWLCLLAIACVEASLSFICLCYSVVFESSCTVDVCRLEYGT